MSEDLVELTAVEQRRMIGAKEVSAGELLDAHLARIEAVNPAVNAIVALDPERRAGRARAAIDDAIARGEDPGPLAGLVTAHKDLTETADFPTSYGSPLFADHRPAADCLLVARMKAAGAVAVGKTNSPEFGAGSHTFNRVHGTTRNPWGTDRSAGGSSGGAAVALTCRMVATADGSDTGGSLRNPAAWNNVIGFRPSIRVVPRVGPGNAWMPLSTEGPMGRTVDDVALLLGVLGQPDDRDPMQIVARPARPRSSPPDRPLRVAWSADLGLPIEPEQLAVLAGARAAMEGLGWTTVDATPDLPRASDSFRVLRAWNIANGLTSAFGDRLDEIKATIQDEIRRGEACSQADVAAAYAGYNDCWVRTAAFFDEGYDLLACPVTQVAPFPTEWEYPTEINGIALANYIDWMEACWRITTTGCPALSLPAGFDAAGLPVGVQLVARQGRDIDLLRAAKALEEATGFAARRPPVVRPRRRDGADPGPRRRPRRAPSRSSTRPGRGRSPRSTTTPSASPAPCPSPTATGWRSWRRPGTTSWSPSSPAGTPAPSPCRCTRRTPIPSRPTCSATAGPPCIVASPAHREAADRLAAAADIGVVDVAARGLVHRYSPSLDRPALMIYTSGTTGRPKGVVHTHGSLAAMVDGMIGAWAWTPTDRTVLVLPLNHVHGLVNITLTALAVGATCEAPGAFDATHVWERLASGEVTVFMAVPTVYARLVAAWQAADASTQQRWSTGAAGLRLMVSGSAALPVSTLDEWRQLTGHTLLERYGMSELGMVLSNTLERRVPGHVGEPMPGVVERASSTTPAPTSPKATPGELLVRGPQVFAGYWDRPEATAEAFVDGWFRTGDVAVHEPDGLPPARALVGRHHQVGRREGVGAGDRGGLPDPPRHHRRRRRRPPGRGVGPARRRRRRRGRRPRRRRAAGVGQDPARRGEGPDPLRVRRRPPPQHHRQGHEARGRRSSFE